MGKKEIYGRTKENLLNDNNICEPNKKLFKKFLEYEEYKLKRRNGLKELDDACYKTLSSYPHYLRNVNLWFKNKDWKKLTKTDIKSVYDDLEDGKLKGSSGKLITYKPDYYNKILRSKPFAMAGKRELAIEVMEFYSGEKKQHVRFFEEQAFKKIITGTKTKEQNLLCWLAWDFGENIFTLLQLQKKDFVRRVQEHNKEPEYVLIFPQNKLKRSRTARSEPTLYKETVDLLDIILPDLEDGDYIFDFGHRNALKFLHNICNDVKVKTFQGQEITWKDFRSGMCCHLLKQGWSTDEIKGRIGHNPSSNVLDMYVSYLALNKAVPKKKIEEGKLRQLSDELEEFRQREGLYKRKFETLEIKQDLLKEYLQEFLGARIHVSDQLLKINRRLQNNNKRHFEKSDIKYIKGNLNTYKSLNKQLKESRKNEPK